jgi:hypothetical protein
MTRKTFIQSAIGALFAAPLTTLASKNTGSCPSCGQLAEEQGGKYPCKDCGVPTVHDPVQVTAINGYFTITYDFSGDIDSHVRAYTDQGYEKVAGWWSLGPRGYQQRAVTLKSQSQIVPLWEPRQSAKVPVPSFCDFLYED